MAEKPEERLEAVRKDADRYKEAVRDLSTAAVRLWSTRIDMAIAGGDMEAVQRLVNPRPGLPDGTVGLCDNNTNCPCGGGGGASW